MFTMKTERRGYVLWMVLVTGSASAPLIKAGHTWTYKNTTEKGPQGCAVARA